MAMPDFVGIGAQKAGTTWLYDMLAQNPSVWLPPLKEVHYFDDINAPPQRHQMRRDHIEQVANRLGNGTLDRGSLGDVRAKEKLLRSLLGDHYMTPEWYGSIFDGEDAEGRVKGEITPSYLALEGDELKFMADMLPKTRFLLIVREPTERTMSQLKMAVQRMKMDPANARKGWQTLLNRIKANARGNYSTAIPLWLEAVGAERMLIRPFGMVRREPDVLIHEIEDFIGAERFDDYRALDEVVHKTKDVIEIPDWVVEEVEAMGAPQKDYLTATFGEEFYKNTR